MPSTPNHINGSRQRRNTLELQDGCVRASDEQIRKAMPELFDGQLQMKRVREVLVGMEQNVNYGNYIRSSLAGEDCSSFDEYLQNLISQIKETLTDAEKKFEIRHTEGPRKDPLKVNREHSVENHLSNISDLLKSIEGPVAELKQLSRLSNLIHPLHIKITELKSTLAKTEDVLRRKQQKEAELEAELDPLLDKGIEGSLINHERHTMDKLKQKIAKLEAPIKELSAEAKEIRKQVNSCQQKIDSAMQALSRCLRQEKMNLSGSPEITTLVKGKRSYSIDYELQTALKTPQKDTYPSYSPQAEQNLERLKRKRSVIKWARRVSLPLILTCGVAYAARNQIDELIHGPKLDPEVFQEAGVQMPTDPQRVHTLLTHNKDLALTKVRILKAIEGYVTKNNAVPRPAKWIDSVLEAKSPQVLTAALNAPLARILKSFKGDTLTYDLDQKLIDFLKGEFGEDLIVSLTLTDPEFSEELEAKRDTGQRFVFNQRDLCRFNGGFAIRIEFKIDGEFYKRGDGVTIVHTIIRKNCLDSFDDPIQRAEQEAKYIRAGLMEYFDQEVFKGVITKDKKILADLHVKNASFASIQQEIVDRLEDSLGKTEIQMLKKASEFYLLIHRVLDVVPNVFLETEGDNLNVTLNPEITNVFKILFGEDAQVGFRLIGDVYSDEKVDFTDAFSIKKEIFCRLHTALTIDVRKKDSKGEMADVFSWIIAKSGYYRDCHGKVISVKKINEFLTYKLSLKEHPIHLYWHPEEECGDIGTKWFEPFNEKKDMEELQSYTQSRLEGVVETPEFQEDFEKIYKANPKIDIMPYEEVRERVEDFGKLDPKDIKDTVFFAAHHKLIEALKKKFGEDIRVTASHVGGGDVTVEGGQNLHYVEKNAFCKYKAFKRLHLDIKMFFARSIAPKPIPYSKDISMEDVENEFFESCLEKRPPLNSPDEIEKEVNNLLTHPLLANYLSDEEKEEFRKMKTDSQFIRYVSDIVAKLKNDERLQTDLIKIANDFGTIFEPVACTDSGTVFKPEFMEAVRKQFGKVDFSFTFDPPQKTNDEGCATGDMTVHSEVVIHPPFKHLMSDIVLKMRTRNVHFMDTEEIKELDADKRKILEHPVVSKYLVEYDHAEFGKNRSRKEFEQYLAYVLKELVLASDFQEDLKKFVASVEPHLTIHGKNRVQISPQLTAALKERYGDDIQLELSKMVQWVYKKFPSEKKVKVNFKDFCDSPENDSSNNITVRVKVPVLGRHFAEFNFTAEIPSEVMKKHCPGKTN